MISTTRSEDLLNLLSRVLLDDEYRKAFSVRDSDNSDGLRSLSFSHHVVVRAFRKLLELATQADNRLAAGWLATEISKEEARIQNAVSFLDAIVRTLNDKGCPAMVIKSLDHWPDLGSDLDLYTNSSSRDVIRLMRENFGAQLHPRSWGDRLAHK